MAWPRRSGPYPDVKGKDVTPTDLLNAARDELWSRTHPGLERASMRCQLLCLPIVLTDRELAGRAAHAWVALTRACHHHPYELPPTAEELARWLDAVEAVIKR